MNWASFEPILVTGAVTIAGGAIATGVNKLFILATSMARVEQKLDDHITDEDKKFANFQTDLTEFGKKLPNGELALLLTKLAAMEAKVCPDGTRYRRQAVIKKQFSRRKRK